MQSGSQCGGQVVDSIRARDSPLGPPRGRIATAGGQCMCMLDKIEPVLQIQRKDQRHRSRQGIGTQMGLTGRFQLSGCGVEATPLPGCRSKTSHADCVLSSAPQLPQGQPSRSHSSRDRVSTSQT